MFLISFLYWWSSLEFPLVHFLHFGHLFFQKLHPESQIPKINFLTLGVQSWKPSEIQVKTKIEI